MGNVNCGVLFHCGTELNYTILFSFSQFFSWPLFIHWGSIKNHVWISDIPVNKNITLQHLSILMSAGSLAYYSEKNTFNDSTLHAQVWKKQENKKHCFTPAGCLCVFVVLSCSGWLIGKTFLRLAVTPIQPPGNVSVYLHFVSGFRHGTLLSSWHLEGYK